MTAPVYDSLLGAVGNTPLVPLRRLTARFAPQVWVKCEFLNPTGSHKDRIGLSMLEWAEQQGLCRPGDTLVEPTSGNTGLGICLAGALKGYHVILTMPDKVSAEKRALMEAYGARVVTAPTALPHDDPGNYMAVAHRIAEEIGGIILNQYENPGNPLAHYETAREIWEQTEGGITHLVLGAGTGGLVTGAGRWFRDHNPAVKLIVGDPEGSIYSGDAPGVYTVEGIGYDFWPGVFEVELVDRIYRISDAESWYWARRLAREEGLLVGGSTGTVFAALIRLIEELPADAHVVMIAHDTGRNYLSKTNLEFLQSHHVYLPLPGEPGGVDLTEPSQRRGMGLCMRPPFREAPVGAGHL